MNYIAVSTKIKAMRAKLLTERDYKEGRLPVFRDDTKRILPYLTKPDRDFITNWNFDASKALQKINALDKQGREALKRVFGTEIDLRNILIMYRLKKYYKIEGDAVYSFLIPSGYKLQAQEIKKLAHSNDFLQAVKSGVYGAFFEDSFVRGEQILTRAVRRQFQKESKREGLALVCGYLYERHLENKNFHIITEGTKQGLSADEIFSLLHYSDFS